MLIACISVGIVLFHSADHILWMLGILSSELSQSDPEALSHCVHLSVTFTKCPGSHIKIRKAIFEL